MLLLEAIQARSGLLIIRIEANTLCYILALSAQVSIVVPGKASNGSQHPPPPEVETIHRPAAEPRIERPLVRRVVQMHKAFSD